MKAISAAILLLLTATPAFAQPAVDPKAGSLYDTIAAQDKRLFDAYNSCDLKTLGDAVSGDLEFYHDQTGLARGRAAFIEAIKTNICGKTHRELIPGTLEVYPLKTYGAVEIGAHVFCNVQKISDCDPDKNGLAKFMMLWRQDGPNWILTRVISYDHVSAHKPN